MIKSVKELWNRPPVDTVEPFQGVANEAPDTIGLLDYHLVLVCPSIHKECGIGRYTNHAAEAASPIFGEISLLETSYQALKVARTSSRAVIVIVQHEYSLLDFQYDLDEDDTTASVITNLSLIQLLNEKNRTSVLMHTTHLMDHGLNRINRQWYSSSIPIFHTNREGCTKAGLNYTDLGVPSFAVTSVPPLPTSFTVGSFGFLSPNKDVSSLLQLCSETGAHLRANYAPSKTMHPDESEAAKKRVLSQMDELGVKGEITFEYLSDEDLRSMLLESSVIYSPQHDFIHFSTTASARFPLAVGRGAIVPPYRCFHDLAGGVRFAQLNDAIPIVRDMIANPQEVLNLAEAGLQSATSNEVGSIYRRLATRLIEGKVSCGGFVEHLRLPVSSADTAEKILHLDDHDPWSHQNNLGKTWTGRGLAGGYITIEADAPAQAEQLAAIAARDADLLAMDAVGKVEATLRGYRNDPTAYRHMRLVCGGNPNYLSVVEFSGLPLYLKAIVLVLKFGIPPERAAVDILDLARAGHARNSVDQIHHLATLFNAYEQDFPYELSDLLWGYSLAADTDRHRDLVYPEMLLGLQDINFLRSLYRLILKRHPDPEGLENHRQALEDGVSKAECVHNFRLSPEAVAADVHLGGTLDDWISTELHINKLVLLSKTLAPFRGRLKSENVELRDRIYAGILK